MPTISWPGRCEGSPWSICIMGRMLVFDGKNGLSASLCNCNGLVMACASGRAGSESFWAHRLIAITVVDSRKSFLFKATWSNCSPTNEKARTSEAKSRWPMMSTLRTWHVNLEQLACFCRYLQIWEGHFHRGGRLNSKPKLFQLVSAAHFPSESQSPKPTISTRGYLMTYEFHPAGAA